MTAQNGMTYPQNYDVIIKWLADALRGEPLEILGIESGRIEVEHEQLEALWEEIKMLDILEFARQKGIEEGVQQGMQQGGQQGRRAGEAEMARTLLMEVLIERFGLIPVSLSWQMPHIEDVYLLRGLFHQALQCPNLAAFETALTQVMPPPPHDIPSSAKPTATSPGKTQQE